MSENQSSSCERGMEKYFFRASAADFRKIPGEPIVYWVSNAFLNIFDTSETLGNKTKARQGLATGDNSIFARLWHEVSLTSFSTQASSCAETKKLKNKWFPYNKGGGFRKWAGFQHLVVNWESGGQEIAKSGMTSFRGKDFYFKEGLTWSDVASGDFSCR